ncbi:hypothetical protein HYC85_031022 [Camellia sinensis]|uniref:Uncharacterized protein n=1 Tax=Camellia sinensis TaxID=4442 RepID=A0A7J7FPW2_CAMSI|nr:hypothetical protein HYC85_031022 [Camellia sinensis]
MYRIQAATYWDSDVTDVKFILTSIPVRTSELGHMLKAMHDLSCRGEAVVVAEMLSYAMANMIGQVMLSQRVFETKGSESSEFKDIVVELMTTTGYFNIGDFIPSIASMDLQGIERGMKGLHKKFDVLITKMIEEHMASPYQRKGKPDFLDVVMAQQENSGEERLRHQQHQGSALGSSLERGLPRSSGPLRAAKVLDMSNLRSIVHSGARAENLSTWLPARNLGVRLAPLETRLPGLDFRLKNHSKRSPDAKDIPIQSWLDRAVSARAGEQCRTCGPGQQQSENG